MAIAGQRAEIRLTDASVTTSTDEAATLSTDGVTLQIDAGAKRYWDIDSTSHPIAYQNSTAVPAGQVAHVNFVQGIVTFSTPHSTDDGYTLDVHHLTASPWVNANQWTLSVDQPLLDANTFASTWRLGVPGLRSAGVSAQGFTPLGGSTNPVPIDFIDTEQRAIVALYPDSTGPNRYEAYAWIVTSQVSAQIDALIGETVDLNVDGEMFYTTNT